MRYLPVLHLQHLKLKLSFLSKWEKSTFYNRKENFEFTSHHPPFTQGKQLNSQDDTRFTFAHFLSKSRKWTAAFWKSHLTKGFGCPLDPPASSIGSDSVRVMATKGKTMQNVYSNLYSQAVTHPSTNRSRPCLTSVIGRELVHSRWYGRRHPSRGKTLMQNLTNSGTRFSDFCCINVQFLRLELPSCWKLFLNTAQRGRQRVTSAPFNAARVRDGEKWIHHHQFSFLIWKQRILIISLESISTLPLDTFKITKDKNLDLRIHCQRSLFEAHVEKLQPAAVGWRW